MSNESVHVTMFLVTVLSSNSEGEGEKGGAGPSYHRNPDYSGNLGLFLVRHHSHYRWVWSWGKLG